MDGERAARTGLVGVVGGSLVLRIVLGVMRAAVHQVESDEAAMHPTSWSPPAHYVEPMIGADHQPTLVSDARALVEAGQVHSLEIHDADRVDPRVRRLVRLADEHHVTVTVVDRP
jgi:hypothetical protein